MKVMKDIFTDDDILRAKKCIGGKYAASNDGDLVSFGSFQKGKVYFIGSKSMFRTQPSKYVSFTNSFIFFVYCPKKGYKCIGSIGLCYGNYNDHRSVDLFKEGKDLANMIKSGLSVNDITAMYSL